MSNGTRKPLVWLHGEVKSPPFTDAGRQEAGTLLRLLQEGASVGMPRCRPMPSIAPGVVELRVRDGGHNWRIVCHVGPADVAVLDVFPKTTQKTPKPVVDNCRRRLRRHLDARA